jgi:hypothetical protein
MTKSITSKLPFRIVYFEEFETLDEVNIPVIGYTVPDRYHF